MQVVLTGHSIVFAPVYFFNCHLWPAIRTRACGGKKPSPAAHSTSAGSNNSNNNNNSNSNNAENNAENVVDGSAVPVEDGAVVPPAAVMDHVQDIENGEHAF